MTNGFFLTAASSSVPVTLRVHKAGSQLKTRFYRLKFYFHRMKTNIDMYDTLEKNYEGFSNGRDFNNWHDTEV